MAWTVDTIYSFSRELINKAQRGEYTPDAFFVFWNAEQRSRMDELVGTVKEAKQTRNAGVIMNSPIIAALKPFIKRVSVAINSGVGLYPSDFRIELALRIDGFEVIHLPYDRIASASNSVIDPPSVPENKYFYSIYNTGMQFLPSSVSSAVMDYIADCADVVWGYTTNEATGLPEYNAGASTQPQWGNNELATITKRTLKMLGVKFSANDFANFGQSVINTDR